MTRSKEASRPGFEQFEVSSSLANALRSLVDDNSCSRRVEQEPSPLQRAFHAADPFVHSALNGGLSWRGSSGLLQNSLSIVPFAAQLAFLDRRRQPLFYQLLLSRNEKRETRQGDTRSRKDVLLMYFFQHPRLVSSTISPRSQMLSTSSYSILCSADLLGPLANFARIT